MKAGKTKQHQEAARGHLPAPSRHDESAKAAELTKGCVAFLVGVESEVQQRFAVRVALLGHPRILELLAEAREEYEYDRDGAIVIPCGAERFRQAVDDADREHGRHHHLLFRLPHLAGYFRPWHVVA